MQKTHILTTAFTLLCGAFMLMLFWKQAQVEIHKDAPPTFSMTTTIAFGYPSGEVGCQGGVPNGTKVTDEDCDDSNATTSGDGCTNSCTIESGWSCIGNTPSVCSAICGNGAKHGSETCDDSNTTNGDGCSAVCAQETGWTCTGVGAGSCTTICGDGLKKGSEGCDDTNTTAGDGCSATCTVESGYSCSGTAPSTCSTTCGDGVKAGSEACDDADTDNGDGCSSTCTVESGYNCSGTTPSVCATGCGDSIMAGAEQCDDGGQTVTCDSDCTTVSCGDSTTNATAGEACDDGSNNGSTKPCTTSCQKTTCGDGTVQAPNGDGTYEVCEPSLNSSCSLACNIQTGIASSGIDSSDNQYQAPVITRLPPPQGCGDGVLNNDEQCDDGLYNGLNGVCDRWCHTTFCGDGVVQFGRGEQCEPTRSADGFLFTAPMCGLSCSMPVCDDFGGCSGGCMLQNLPACQATDVSSLQNPPMQTVWIVPPSSQTQSPMMSTQLPSGQYIAPNYTSVESLFPTTIKTNSTIVVNPSVYNPVSVQSQQSGWFTASLCGDGFQQAGEECDDGAKNSDFIRGACRMNCKLPSCGDSVRDTGEDCDYGTKDNTIGNGCTAVCKESLCGDGVLQPGEECDDGSRNSDTTPDSCSMKCLMPRCGDRINDTNFGELCDAGEDNSDEMSDACRLNCVPAKCGDSVIDTDEQCDDGTENGKGRCTMDCLDITLLHAAAPQMTSGYAVTLYVFIALSGFLVGRQLYKTFLL